MNWDQIEDKWAAMTRRIRADYVTDGIETSGGAYRGRNLGKATAADKAAGAVQSSEIKTPAK